MNLHLISDALTTVAYYFIALILLYFVQKRRDIPFDGIFVLFGAFIVFCGTTHLLSIWTLWHPDYWFEGLMKAVTAIVSLYTAIQLIAILPQALILPSPEKLAVLNRELKQEIEERKKVESKLSESEQYYAGLVAAVPVGIFRADAQGQCLYVNELSCQLAGFTPETAAGDGWQQGLHPEDRERIAAEWYASTRESRPFQLEYRLQDADGHTTWVYGQSVAIRDAAGQTTGYVGTVTDLTARKQVETERQRTQQIQQELKVLELILDNVLAGYWDWRIADNQEYLSPGLKRMLGYEDWELENHPDTWQRLVFPEDLAKVFACFEQHIQSRGRICYYNEVRYRHKDGSTVWVICSGQVIEWGDAGEPIRMVGCHVDISDRKILEQKLQSNGAEMRGLFAAMTDFVLTSDRDSANIKIIPTQAAEQHYDWLERTTSCFWRDCGQTFRSTVARVIQSGATLDLEYQLPPTATDAEPAWFEARISPFGANQAIWVARNISDRKRLEAELQIVNQQLEKLATTDGLTQLANRRKFDETLQQEWPRLQREQTYLAILLFDVDYFKLYNDYYGHPAGDECLRKIAQAGRCAIWRATDLLARYGGEEFVALLPYSDDAGAIKIATRIQAEIAALRIPHRHSEVAAVVTVSIGIASVISASARSPQALIDAADQALYAAKEQGRNRYVVAS